MFGNINKAENVITRAERKYDLQKLKFDELWWIMDAKNKGMAEPLSSSSTTIQVHLEKSSIYVPKTSSDTWARNVP